MTRDEVTQLILTSKRRKQLKWAQLAEATGQSKEWTTAALMGQMTLTPGQAGKVGAMLDLPAEAVDIGPTKAHCPPRRPPIRSFTAFTNW